MVNRNNDSIGLYLSDLAATAPVAPDEERRLVKLLAEGRKAARRLTQYHELDADGSETRRNLAQQFKAGREARRRLIEANGRLVISIAVRYAGRGGPDLHELCQEGVLGLMRAIDKFDPERGTRISTYATWWIRQGISRYVATHTRAIRLPVHQFDRLSRVRKAENQLTLELGRRPSAVEIAVHTGDTVKNVEQTLGWVEPIASLEAPSGFNDDGTYLGDYCAAPGDGPEELAEVTLRQIIVARALSGLTARESRILELRYGLRDGQNLTLEQIAVRFELTRERIRQIEKAALSKLSQEPEIQRLLKD